MLFQRFKLCLKYTACLSTLFLFDESFCQVAAESGEEVAGERADKDADNDVSEIVLSYEDAADRYHECPEEHPPSIGHKPFRHWSTALKASFHSDECAECKSE